MRHRGPSLVLLLFLLASCASRPGEPVQNAVAQESHKEQVTGIGGVFFKARDPRKLSAWYEEHLGIHAKQGYADFKWREEDHPERVGRTVWTIFPTNTKYFGQSNSSLMINYRVANLDKMLAQLRGARVTVEKVVDYDYGRFAWITDPEGNRVELWEPKGK